MNKKNLSILVKGSEYINDINGYKGRTLKRIKFGVLNSFAGVSPKTLQDRQ